MKARLNKPTSSRIWCSKKSDWYTIWFNPSVMIPQFLECFLDNIRLDFDFETNLTRNPPGIEIGVGNFGDTFPVEFITPFEADIFGFHSLVEELTYQGYERGRNIYGAPYDFRKAPYDNQQFFLDLKDLIEKTVKTNGGRSCIVVCHSLGCINFLYFLQQQTQSWKDKYIRSWITMGAPFGGAIEPLEALASGNNILRLFIYDQIQFRPIERTFSSLVFLLPDERVWKDTPVLHIKDKVYYARDMETILKMLGPNEALLRMWKLARRDIKNYDHPGVEVHCLRGTDMSTPLTIKYNDTQFFPDHSKRLYGWGDGTVPEVAGDMCLKWSKSRSQDHHFHEENEVEGNELKKSQGFYSRTFPSVSHIEMLNDQDIISYISDSIWSYNTVNFM